MTYIKINAPKNKTVDTQFMLKMLLLLALFMVAVGVNIYLYKINHQHAEALSGLIPNGAQSLFSKYL